MKKHLNYFKIVFSPPYKTSEIPVLASSAVLLAVLFLTISFATGNTTQTRSNADTANNNSVEPEDGSVSGNVALTSNDQASGGRYLVFSPASTSPTQINTPTPTQIPTPTLSANRCTGLENPPDMDPNNTVTFTNVCPGDSGWPTNSQMQGKDVRIILPKDRKCKAKSTAIGGYDNNPARDIWISGGNLDYTAGENGSSGLTFAWWSGTVFIEGIQIDMNNSCNDVVRSYRSKGGNARMVIQNSYLRGAGYCTGGTHGDIVHIQGGEPSKNDTVVKELVLQNVRGDAITQGIFVPYRTDTVHGVRKLTLDRVDLHLDADYKWSEGRISTMIYAYPYGDNKIDLPPPDGQSFKDVYLNWWDPWYPTTIDRKDITVPAVTGYDGNNCGIFSSEVISKAKITGQWCKGTPPKGTYAPADLIGQNYDRATFCK